MFSERTPVGLSKDWMVGFFGLLDFGLVFPDIDNTKIKGCMHTCKPFRNHFAKIHKGFKDS